jgi:hypothetical protein
MDDILTLSEDITASERRGLGEKNGDFFLGSDVRLSKYALLMGGFRHDYDHNTLKHRYPGIIAAFLIL